MQLFFSIALAINGNTRDQRGWAVNPAGGVVHWATFETKRPLGFDKGTTLRFVIHQNHNAKMHRLGRFRLSVTTDAAPIRLSLPEDLKAIVSTPADQRDEKQTNTLLAYFRKTNRELLKKQLAVAEAKKPLPEEPGVTNRRKTLEYLKQPVQDDPLLVRLRSDADQSKQQVANKRLTAAQDLAWALINNPAFLFNR